MRKWNYYNDVDPHACAWVRELIKAKLVPDGEVDERSIKDVKPDDLRGFVQCHFFCGILGWSLALDLAGWDRSRPVWTGSCPCQPFSKAGFGGRENDPRHLWPTFRRLIRACRPAVVFGEQVPDEAWMEQAGNDLASDGYAVRAEIRTAAEVGANSLRERIYFWASSDTASNGRERILASIVPQVPQNRTPETLAARDLVGNPFSDWKKLLATPRVRRLDDGVSSTLAVRPALQCLGNAIVPQVAAAFIKAFIETEGR